MTIKLTRAQKINDKLSRMAYAARKAKDRFENALEKARENEKLWAEICDECNVDPGCTVDDWFA